MLKNPINGQELPEGWNLVKVDQIKAEEKHSCVAGPFGSDISSKYFQVEGVPIIRGNNIRLSSEKFIPRGFVFVSPKRARKYIGQHVRSNDLVFTCWGTLGQVGIIPEDGPFDEYIISNKQLKLRADSDKANPNYLYYYFSSGWMVKYINNIAIGAAVPGINLGLLKNLPVVLPPLPIQDEIAECLDWFHQLIDNNNQRIKLLEEMAEEIYKEWFVRMRFPGYQDCKFFDKEGKEVPHGTAGALPEGWESQRIGELCIKITDGSHSSPIPREVGFPMPSVKDMRDYKFDLSASKRISNEDFEKLVKANCKPLLNDIVIAKDGSYLKHVFLIQEELELVVLSSIAILRPDQSIVNPTFLTFMLKSPFLIGIMGSYVSGSALPRIILNDFKKIRVNIPPIHVQEQFFRLTNPTLKQIYNLLQKNQVLQETRDLLLPRLISGKLDVKNLELPETNSQPSS